MVPLRLAGIRLLLAEDSWIIAEALKEVLQHHGAKVAGPVSTVADARRLANDGLFDAAVFDVNLRGELATELIVELAGRGVEIVVLSGYSIDRELQGKVALCLEKPVSESQLVDAVAKCVGR
jgi:DNA-binding response OmpR family regulator